MSMGRNSFGTRGSSGEAVGAAGQVSGADSRPERRLLHLLAWLAYNATGEGRPGVNRQPASITYVETRDSRS